MKLEKQSYIYSYIKNIIIEERAKIKYLFSKTVYGRGQRGVSEGHFRNKHIDGKSDSREKGTGKRGR